MKKTVCIAAAFLISSLQEKAQICFSPTTNYTVASGAISSVSADFNGDGNPDVAAANFSANSVSVLLGNSSGALGTPTSYSVGNRPMALCSADFNSDGMPDVAVVNYIDNNVSVLLGIGGGALGTATNYSIGSGAYGIVAADFNGDGKADLATANYSSATVSVFLNSGTGTFGSPANYGVGTNPYSLTSADFNNDGHLDLAIANYGSANVSVLLNSGSGGTFGAAANFGTGGNPESVTTADYNGDGKPDLATANFGNDSVSVLLNAGAGAFGSALNYAAGNNPSAATSADFNLDGKPDLAIANNGGDNVSLLLNIGSGTFGAAINYNVEISPTSVLSADFNSDGKPDIATANFGDNSVSTIIQCVIPGAALNFNGTTNNSASVASFSNLTNNLSFGAFVNWAGSTGMNQMIVVNGNTGSSGYAIFVNNASSNQLAVVLGGNAIMQSNATLTAGTWQNVTAVCNGGTWTLYVAGMPYTLTSNTVVPNVPAGSFVIGANQMGSENFNGSIDEVRFWGRALCQGEIQNNMVGELPMPRNNLLAYYKLNEGFADARNPSVTTAIDSSGNGHNLTLTSFSLAGSVSNWVAPGAVTTGSNAPVFVSPVISVSADTILCMGNTTTLTASGNVTHYIWNTTATTPSIVVSPTVTTLYMVVGTNSLGCLSNQILKTVTVSNSPLPTISANASLPIACYNSMDMLNASGAHTYTWSTGQVGASVSITPTVVTTYSVTGTDLNGCMNTATVSVGIHPLPTLSVSATPTLCAGSTEVLTASGAATYTWTAPSSFSMSPTASASVSVSPTVNITYSVVGMDTNGCMNKDTAHITVYNCTGIEQFAQNKNDISVYPNPATNQIMLQSTKEIGSVAIYNSIGQAVEVMNVRDTKTWIDISRYTPGIYMIVVGSAYLRFMKE
ncbi:MAG: VCBS repeat-containing protein [Bacteroidetes bacterium]|nr:VCBS repeat-containing protein [Bacteroidota bacterium]